MRSVCVIALGFLAVPLFAQTLPNVSISTQPVTPAWGETFTITVRGTWPDGCVPQFQSVDVSGTTIRVHAILTSCNAVCPQLVSPYAFQTTGTVVPDPGIYQIEYHLKNCNGPDTIVATSVMPVARSCSFDRALSSGAPAVHAGSSVLLHWCDPSFSPGPDQGMNVSFFRVLMAHSADGPFVPLTDIGFTNIFLLLQTEDAGSVYFFVEAHMCTETIAGCSGDTVLRSNIVRVDVAPTGGCLPDATTLCLNNGRFQVRARWTANDGTSGDGQAVPFASDSGWFWFFGPDNVEIVAKVLNGCSAASPSYWFFASGLTNVGVDLTVMDTKMGVTKVYHNPLNHAFTAIQDTSAFSTCP